MVAIKFSHYYEKIPRDYKLSLLLDVLPVKLEDLSEYFLRYDTTFVEGGEAKEYRVPKKGEYMLIFLQAGSGHGRLWTTLRSRWGSGCGGNDKLAYYKSHIGEVVDCVVLEPNMGEST